MEKPPKSIALVANTSWNLVHFRTSLAEQLREKGYRVLAIAPPGPYSKRLLSEPFSRYYPWTRLKAHGRNIFREWQAAWELRRLYQILRPDLALHFTIKPNMYGSWAASGLGIPSISTITGLGYPFLHPVGGNQFVPYLYRDALKGSSATVFQNEDDRSLFLKKRIVDEARALLIRGSGVDTRYFSPQKGERIPDTFTFLYAGRLLRDKGIMEFLEAGRRISEKFPQARFQVAGEPEPENPSALSEKELMSFFTNPAFRCWGFVDDIRPLMAGSDVFVLPSYREGMPRAVLEAMAMGKPVITSDAPGCKETVEPGVNGLLSPVGDTEALGLAMKQMLEADPAMLEAMGARCLQKARDHFDIRAINRQFLDLIEQVLKDGITAKTSPVVF
ncbi:MAG: glycosyltransferase family 4 protein [Saprospirales bacterium]|nr:glycosyltransferase family 4 protein [Saprospirales bacterium]